MSAALQRETMLRKPILMPPRMISKVDQIAKEKNVSFAEVVREAVDGFDPDLSNEDSNLLEALAEALVESTKEAIKKIETLEKKLDETHSLLEDL